MATLLFRLGRFAYRRAVAVLIAWIALAGAALGVGLAFGGHLEDSYEIPGTESQQAIDLLAAVFPQTAGASAQAVVHTTDGSSIKGEHSQQLADFVSRLDDVPGVDSALSPFDQYATDAVSKDGTTVIVDVQFTDSAEQVTPQTLDGVQAAAAPLADAGMQVAFGGQPFQQAKLGLSVIELAGVVFAGLVLIVAFGSFLAAGMPLVSALLALGVSMGLVLSSAAFTTVSTTTPMLALMIGLAVGIDYALFILSRHRSQLAAGMDAEESAATAVATAGSSVVFAGLTVVIALLGLLVVGIPFLGVMGIAAAVSVVFAMLAATTLLPAIMGLFKGRLAPKPGSRAAQRAIAARAEATGEPIPEHKKTMGERWAAIVVKAPVAWIVGVLAVLGLLAVPAASLTLALPDGGAQPVGSTARQAYDLISDEFGPGHNGPLIVTVDLTQTTDVLGDLHAIADRLGSLDGVAATSSGTPNATVDTGIIQVIPTTGPADPATTALVQRIRDLAPSLDAQYSTHLAVTGTTAVMIDISSRLDQALLPFGIVVVGLSIILLAIVFRSVLVPLKAALGYLLSMLASLGAVVAVFQWGWGASLLHVQAGPVMSFTPVILMAILFGLAMDYEVFLVSGMREAYVHGVAGVTDPKQQRAVAKAAVVRGFSGAVRVVTAAALIMFFVFAAFIPDGGDVLTAIAFGLAFGIAVDAFLVRMTLVPAVMALAGRWAWKIPKWLDRLLPNVDVEGESLREHREAVDWAQTRVAAGEAITLDGLSAQTGAGPVGPYHLAVPQGSIAVLDRVGDDPTARRLFAATVSGRLAPAAGRAQVAGHPLPSEAESASRRVALGDLDGPARLDVEVTLGSLLTERIRLTGRWLRAFRARRFAALSIARINDALRAVGRAGNLDARTGIVGLPQLERAVALAEVALAEETPVVLLDAADPFAGPADASAFLAALARLVPPATTVVVGVPALATAVPSSDDRAVVLRPASLEVTR